MEPHDHVNTGMGRFLDALLQGADVAATLLSAAEIADPLCLTDADGRIIWANPAFERIVREPASAIPGRFAIELLGIAQDDPRLSVSLRAVLVSGHEFRGAWIRGTGTPGSRTLELHLRPVRDRSGRPRGVVWWVRDVSARRELERWTLLDRSLTRSLRRIEANLVTTRSPDEFLPAVLPEVGTALRATRAGAVPAGSAKAFRPREFVGPGAAPILADLLEMDPAEVERWTRRTDTPPLVAVRDARTFPLPDFASSPLSRAGTRAFLVVPLVAGDRFIGYLAADDTRGPRDWSPAETGFFLAVGEKVERAAERWTARVEVERRIGRLEESLERAVRAAGMKDALLAELAHEVRSPMTAILGYAELLGRHGGSRELVEDWVRQLRRNAGHVVSVVDDVLHLARAESGRLEPRLEPVELVPLVKDAARSAAAEARGKGLAFRVTCAAGVPRAIHTDRAMLRRILRNLLSNAVRFTEEGEVRLSLSFRPGAGGWGLLVAEVRDTGAGIPPEMLGRIFEPFLQVPGPNGTARGGTGLGLAIARRYARILGGQIEARSESGRGSLFLVSLEVEVPDPGDVLPPGEIQCGPSSGKTGSPAAP